MGLSNCVVVLHSNELDNEAVSTPVDISVSIDEPSVEEVYAAIKRLRNGHAPDLIVFHQNSSNVQFTQSLILYIPSF